MTLKFFDPQKFFGKNLNTFYNSEIILNCFIQWKPKNRILSSISLKSLSFLAIILPLWVSHKFWLWFFLPFPERPSAKIAHSQLCANQNFEKPFGISTYAFSKSCIMVNMIRSRPNWEPNFFSQRLDWRKFKQWIEESPDRLTPIFHWLNISSILSRDRRLFSRHNNRLVRHICTLQ